MSISLDDPEGRQRYIYRRKIISYIIGIVAVVIIAASGITYAYRGGFSGSPAEQPPSLRCDQPASITPDWEALNLESSEKFVAESYISRSVELLAGAVKIPTETYDDMELDPKKDKRFDVFKDLHRYLFDNFPLSAEYAETVNTYGLLYTIEGSDSSLKPAVIMSHQDVVPVNPKTADGWDHPAFSGHYDGEWIYGRGTCDTKNTLIGTLEAVEALLEQDWKPRRTILLSFGFDEEIVGVRGGKELAKVIEDRYGYHGVEVIVDEGMGVQRISNTLIATPGVTEKGRVDYNVTLNVPGGHSSAPPDHTGIGILSQLIYNLEQDPFSPLGPDGSSVVMSTFSCLGHHGVDLDTRSRELYSNFHLASYRQILLDTLASDLKTRILVETTQAIDVIRGGIKVNALPEQSSFEVNYRLDADSSLQESKQRFLSHSEAIADEFGLSLYFDGNKILSGKNGDLRVLRDGMLEPAPVTPFYDDLMWSLVSGITRHVFRDVVDAGDVITAPGLLPANTDTAHYWGVSKRIYRYTGVLTEDMVNYHTVNEKLRFRSHISTVAWLYEFLVNVSL